MPRIPVRTTPYHTLPRCTRHYKSKRDLILRALGKASFINGSQFVIAWISPKGEVDVYASELLQAAVSPKEGGVLSRKELEREATRVRGEMGRRWEEIRRLEEAGEAPSLEDDAEEGGEQEDAEDEDNSEEIDADRTLVDDMPPKLIDINMANSLAGNALKKPSPTAMMSTFPAAAARSSTPSPPMHTLTLAPPAIENYYASRFAALQQATCKLVVKAWIKVIEPKKQMKFPYNKGEELKPAWWPEGVRHREPDHLSKQERLTLLCSIVRSPLISVARLELSTAEAAAFISRPRLAILREVYLVAKEEEKRRKENDLASDLIVHLPNLPVSPSAVSPEGPEKRTHSQFEALDKENIAVSSSYAQHSQKRMKHPNRLAALTTANPNSYDGYTQPFTFAPAAWREPATAPAHLQYETYGSEYRSPNPDPSERYHPNHLAPILNHHHSSHTTAAPTHVHSPIDSPAFSHSATMSASTSQPGSGYYGRAGSYMQQQQVEYLHQHGHTQHGYDYGSPYITDNQWDAGFATSA